MIPRLNTLADGWLDALWNASLQGGAALLVVWCICRFVPRISPAFKVWLWRIAWLKLLLAFFWSGSLDLPLLAPPSSSSGAILPAPVSGISQELPLVPTAVIEPSLSAGSVLFILWLFGVFCCAIHLGYQWNRSARLKRAASPVANAALAEACSKLGIARLPALCESAGISTPILIGILRPTIIVPSRSVTSDELRMMLAHELAHLKRRDLLWGWLPAICHTLFFFHPLLWLTRREWLLAQEMACDELALSQAGVSPASYGNMLLELISSPASRPTFGRLGICETSKNLKRRILAMKTIGTRKSRWLIGALLVLSLAGILPWRIVAQEKPEDADKRIQQLEKENAELRAELEKLKQTAKPNLSSEALRAAESARLAEERNRLSRRARSNIVEQNAIRQQSQLKRDEEVAARQRELYLEELALAQKYADSLRKGFEVGRITLEELSRAQRQVFAIKREIAGLERNRAKVKETIEEEMAVVSRLLKDAQKRIEIGTAAPGHELDLQRELLKLKRELLLLE
jgi:beta-lactamase regulating signal transducer with metallopeptidase domain